MAADQNQTHVSEVAEWRDGFCRCAGDYCAGNGEGQDHGGPGLGRPDADEREADHDEHRVRAFAALKLPACFFLDQGK